MVCPKCESIIEAGSICPGCKVDAVLFATAIRVSDRLYNSGLFRAQTGDLAGAVDSLVKCAAVNKNHILARNLLGLVYYEVGHIGEALTQWVVSSSLMKEGNPAVGYIDSVQKSGRDLDKLNDSIRMYNQALRDLRLNSDDMAIIKLRQATDSNPKFVDALNLLALCYLHTNEKDKAAMLLDRVLKIDSSNPSALFYYSKIGPVSSVRARRAAGAGTGAGTGAGIGVGIGASSAGKPQYKQMPYNERKPKNFHLTEILAFLVGAACCLAVLYFVAYPTLERDRNQQISVMAHQMEQLHYGYAEELEALEHELEQLSAERDSYANISAELEEQNELNMRSLQVFSAAELFRQDRLLEAVDALDLVDLEGLPLDVLERADELRRDAYPVLLQQHFNTGLRLYNARNFTDARPEFLTAARFMEFDPNMQAELLFYLGWTYSQGIDNEQAIRYFERLLEEHPGHRRAAQGRTRLNTIQG